ncbi:MAG TPA: tetratricopeptide repeat protein, partial [Kofleriaceae bacterium]|nr:tetratricopeptide repeat protein [Kofleriaceae bacterium]
QMVLVADRYLLLPSLGFALCVAVGLARINPFRARVALSAVLVVAASIRTLDARTNWSSSLALWERAVTTNPADGDAWSKYTEALVEAHDPERAFEVVSEGEKHSRSPRLLMRKALLVLDRGDRAEGMRLMQQAADGGEFRAMTNLALLLLEANEVERALGWARRGAAAAPLYANGQRALGKIALQAQRSEEALAAFERAYTLEPGVLSNRFNLALALIAVGRPGDARPHLEACVADPVLGPRARQLLGR